MIPVMLEKLTPELTWIVDILQKIYLIFKHEFTWEEENKDAEQMVSDLSSTSNTASWSSYFHNSLYQ